MPITISITTSQIIPWTKPRPFRSANTTFITMRRQAKSWMEKKRRITDPSTPDICRAAIMRERSSDSSFLYTGTIWESWLRMAPVAASLLRR